jgi:hypothetical protein
MFRVSWDPSSGSTELHLTEITPYDSLAFIVCLVGIWQCNFWTCSVYTRWKPKTKTLLMRLIKYMIKLLFILKTFYYYRLKSLKYYYLDNWHEHSSFLTLGTPGTLQECDICLCRVGANIWLLAGIVHDGKHEAEPSNVTFAEAIKIKLLSACALNVYLTGVHLCLQSLECEVCCCFLSLIVWRTSYCLDTWIIQKGVFLYLELHEEFNGVDGKSDHCVCCNTTVEVGQENASCICLKCWDVFHVWFIF